MLSNTGGKGFNTEGSEFSSVVDLKQLSQLGEFGIDAAVLFCYDDSQ